MYNYYNIPQLLLTWDDMDQLLKVNIDVFFYDNQTMRLKFYNVQTTNLTFVDKRWDIQ